jgi:hypothetical protein
MKMKSVTPPLYQSSYEVEHALLIDEEDFERQDSEAELLNWAPREACKFCRSRLEVLRNEGRHGEDSAEYWIDVSRSVRACISCGWWRYEFRHGGETLQRVNVTAGAILSPEEASAWAPVPILREFLTVHPAYTQSDLDPIKLEQVVREVLRDHLDVEVHWTGRGADGSFDLFYLLGDTLALLCHVYGGV